jgi:DNA end-binding protein Ku
MSGPWQPTDYRDTYTDRVNELIKAKKKGAEFRVAEEAPEATEVADLMEVLRRSVEDARQQRTTKRTAAKRSRPTTSTAKKATAKKATAKKATAKKATAKKATAKKAA